MPDPRAFWKDGFTARFNRKFVIPAKEGLRESLALLERTEFVIGADGDASETTIPFQEGIVSGKPLVGRGGRGLSRA